MKNWNDENLLELIEMVAEYNGWIASEDELSDLFDEHIAPMVLEQYDEDDTVAFNEAFNDWTDSLCKEGTIHHWQYENYCYVGKYSE